MHGGGHSGGFSGGHSGGHSGGFSGGHTGGHFGRHQSGSHHHVAHHHTTPHHATRQPSAHKPHQQSAHEHHTTPDQRHLHHHHHPKHDHDSNHKQDQCQVTRVNVYPSIMRSMPTRSSVHYKAIHEMARQDRKYHKNCSKTYRALRQKVGMMMGLDNGTREEYFFTDGNEKSFTPNADVRVEFAGTKEELFAETERLRGFLSHLLSIDYDAREFCPVPLRKEDWIHYTRLAKIAFDTYATHHPPSRSSTILLDWSDHCCQHPEIDQYIVAPANELQIRTRTVISLLCSFIYRHGFWMGPGLHRYRRLEFDYGALIVAYKLKLDQNELLEKLCPNDATSTDYLRWIKQENERQQNIYFERLESPMDFGIKDYYEDRLESYGLVAWCLQREQQVMQKKFKRIKYMKAAMEGFPDEPNCSWWKKYVVAWRGRCCAKKLFGSQAEEKSDVSEKQ